MLFRQSPCVRDGDMFYAMQPAIKEGVEHGGVKAACNDDVRSESLQFPVYLPVVVDEGAAVFFDIGLPLHEYMLEFHGRDIPPPVGLYPGTEKDLEAGLQLPVDDIPARHPVRCGHISY